MGNISSISWCVSILATKVDTADLQCCGDNVVN